MKVTIESESSEVIRRHISISDIEVGELLINVCVCACINWKSNQYFCHPSFSTTSFTNILD